VFLTSILLPADEAAAPAEQRDEVAPVHSIT